MELTISPELPSLHCGFPWHSCKHSPNRSKFPLLKSKVGILLFAFIPSLSILNSTISQPLQPIAKIFNQSSLPFKDQVQPSMCLHRQHCHPCHEFITPMHIAGCFVICAVGLPADIRYFTKISHKIEWNHVSRSAIQFFLKDCAHG